MKISYNWIQDYLDFKLPPVADLVQRIGAQLGEVEEVTCLAGQYQGIPIVEIKHCQPVPDSDHLNTCLIDDGGVIADVERTDDGLVQVVCGAPNVRAGLVVAWLPPGVTVPSTYTKEPLVLGARKLRGVISNGMLASPQELAIGDSHEGILELPGYAPGTWFRDAFALNDYIITIENKMFTHRPDCFGILGVAREIAGILGHAFVEPNWYSVFTKNLLPLGEQLPLTIHNLAPELVPRFMALALRGITVTHSDVKLQSYLSRVGVRPINNIVDTTNYFMYLTGQPLHAYDYDKVRALDSQSTATIVARQATAGEQLMLLNGKTIEPRPGAIVIATNAQVIGLAGVMGGASTEVDATTTAIILESATFDMYSIRKTSMVHGLLSEAVTRFNKGQSPYQNDRVLLAAAHLLCDTAGAQFASDVFDEVSNGLQVNRATVARVTLTPEFINTRLGSRLSASDIRGLLSNVGFVVEPEEDPSEHTLHVNVPFWRTDIAIPEDIVEEVGRLYGFDGLPLVLPSRSVAPAAPDALLQLKQRLRDALCKAGANETLNYSFVHGDLLRKVGQDPTLAYRITAALSPELQYYRLTITPSLLDKIHANVRAGYNEFALFELGKTHQAGPDAARTADTVPIEGEQLGFVITADAKAAKQYDGAPYYQAVVYLKNLLQELHVTAAIRFDPLGSATQETVYYAPGRSAQVYVGETVIGFIGEYSGSVKKALKLPVFTAGFELRTTALLQLMRQHATYRPLAKFPKIEQDICLRVPASVTFAEVTAVAHQALATAVETNWSYGVTPVDIYQKADDLEYKQVTLRVSVTNYDRTMTEVEVSAVLTLIAQAAHAELQAERV